MKVTERLIAFIEQLIEDGYDGEISITKSRASGAAQILGDAIAIELKGFCKETVQIVDDGEYCIVIGRYSEELRTDELTTEKITEIAWRKYKTYKERGYSRPSEFEALFIKFGYLSEKTKIVLEEKQ